MLEQFPQILTNTPLPEIPSTRTHQCLLPISFMPFKHRITRSFRLQILHFYSHSSISHRCSVAFAFFLVPNELGFRSTVRRLMPPSRLVANQPLSKAANFEEHNLFIRSPFINLHILCSYLCSICTLVFFTPTNQISPGAGTCRVGRTDRHDVRTTCQHPQDPTHQPSRPSQNHTPQTRQAPENFVPITFKW